MKLYRLIFTISLVGMLGPLYFSNFGDPILNLKLGVWASAGLEPCLLCYWARIFMYPIVLISGVAIWTRDEKSYLYILPLSILGTFLTAYHYAIQKMQVSSVLPCGAATPCEVVNLQYAGFITIPFLAFLAFLAIAVVSVYLYEKNH